MSDTTTTPKKRGRPKGPRPALTSAERMRQARERVREALFDPHGDITALPDQLLLEAVALAYRKDMPGALFFGVRALFERLNANGTSDHAYQLRVELVPKGDTVTNTYSVTVAEKESEDTHTVADIEPIESDTVTTARPLKPKDYPDSLKAKAVAMHRSGESRKRIAAMLIEQFGKAPDVSNWSKTMKRWENSDGTALVSEVEALEQDG